MKLSGQRRNPVHLNLRFLEPQIVYMWCAWQMRVKTCLWKQPIFWKIFFWRVSFSCVWSCGRYIWFYRLNKVRKKSEENWKTKWGQMVRSRLHQAQEIMIYPVGSAELSWSWWKATVNWDWVMGNCTWNSRHCAWRWQSCSTMSLTKA